MNPKMDRDRDLATPGLLKIKKLTEKLVNLQLGMEHEKDSRKDMNMFKITNLEDKVTKIKATEELRFNVFPKQQFKESLIKLQEQVSKERESREIFDERKSKEVKLLENNLTIDINIEKQNGKEAFGRLNKAVEEKLFEVKIELGKEKSIREESEDKRIQEFTNEISLLQEAVENETQTRELGYDRLLKKIKEEMGRMYEIVEVQGRVREESHRIYTNAVDEMDNGIRQEIGKEKKERESTEETLIRLLEETCSRVEVGLSHNLYSN